MPDAWVVNASPLIILSRINRLDFLENLASAALIPAAVIAEVGAGLHRDPSAATAQQWAKKRILPNLTLPTTIAAWGLGAGESQVVVHCLGNARIAVLDDQAGRACARAHGIPVVGALGVILLARQQGLIKQAHPWIMQAQAAGLFLSPGLVTKVLASIGE